MLSMWEHWVHRSIQQHLAALCYLQRSRCSCCDFPVLGRGFGGKVEQSLSSAEITKRSFRQEIVLDTTMKKVAFLQLIALKVLTE